MKLYVCGIALVGLLAVSTALSAQVTYSHEVTSSGTGCTRVVTTTYYDWAYTDSSGASHSFPGSNIMTQTGDGPGCKPQMFQSSLDEYSTDSEYYLQATGASLIALSGVYNPLYKVVSVLYSPPGNESSQGYGGSSTDGTMTTIGSSFTFSEELTFTAGSPDVVQGSGSFGFSETSSDTQAFTQTFTNTTSIATDDNSSSTYNPTQSNVINHNLDSLAIWLNPQIWITTSGTAATTPVSDTAVSQPTPGVSSALADILVIPAVTMEATPPGTTGVTTVPVSYLVPQAVAGENGVDTFMPGLGAICKNNTLYQEQLTYDEANPSTANEGQYCNQANQCGCKPTDFVNILQTDPLLN